MIRSKSALFYFITAALIYTFVYWILKVTCLLIHSDFIFGLKVSKEVLNPQDKL